MGDLPRHQRPLDHFPRFGAYYPARAEVEAAAPVLRVSGAVKRPLEMPVTRLESLERRDQVADFHCVAGWTRQEIRWSGVGFRVFHDSVIKPEAEPDPEVTHVVFEGADGYRAVCLIEDAMEDDVLLADRLEGAPLTYDHGAPLRLLSPRQYAYKSAKHVVAIELHRGEPPDWHPRAFRRLLLAILKPHPRARVSHEERHRYLPAWAVRWFYRRLFRPFIWLGRRGLQAK